MTKKLNVGDTVWVWVPDESCCTFARVRISSIDSKTGVIRISPITRDVGEFGGYFLCQFKEEHLFHTLRKALIPIRNSLISDIKKYKGKIQTNYHKIQTNRHLLMGEEPDEEIKKTLDDIERYQEFVENDKKNLAKVKRLLRKLK